MLVYYGGAPTWRLHTGLCKLVQNISTTIWSLGKRADLKFGEMPYLFISYNIIISWLYTVNGFRIIFLLRDSATQEFPKCHTHAYTRFENGCSENSTQKLLTKYSREEKNKHVICRPWSVRIGKNCPLGLEYGPQPAASVRTQDLWHSFSQYGPPGRQITYISSFTVKNPDMRLVEIGQMTTLSVSIPQSLSAVIKSYNALQLLQLSIHSKTIQIFIQVLLMNSVPLI